MAEAARKRCTVVFATPERQYQWSVELDADESVGSAIERARGEAGAVTVPWETCDLGIFGETCERSTVPCDGDRIELYRPLACDPKQARRDRVRRARAGGRSGR